MSKILGLDLGTNSIGWAVVEHEKGTFRFADGDGKPTKGVIIFPEGVKIEKGNEKSRAAERTGYRSARRLKFRRKLRKYQTLKVLINQDFQWCPLSETALEKWHCFKNPDTGKTETFRHYPKEEEFLEWLKTDEAINKNPYYFRDKFSREKYDWETNQAVAYELGRAFYHLAQRRGFASNKIDSGSEDKVEDLRMQWQNIKDTVDESTTIPEMKENIDLMNENFKDEDDRKVKSVLKNIHGMLKKKNNETQSLIDAVDEIFSKRENLGKVKQSIADLDEKIKKTGCETLGQHFYKLYQKDRHNNEYKIRTKYTGREEHYLKEFEVICEKQDLPVNFIFDLKKAIFYQRPLKSQKGLVGKCSFEKNKPRCPISHPAFEEYRMWSFLNNIEIRDDGKFRKLNTKEKEKVLDKFYRKKTHFDFKEIAKVLRSDYPVLKNSKTEPDPNKQFFNYKGNASVSGCPVTAELMGIFGRRWEDKKDWKVKLFEIWKNKIHKDGSAKTEKEVVNEFWHALFYADIVGDKKELIGKSRKEKLKEFAEKNTSLTPEQVIRFSKIKGLKKDYANLSLNAIYKILPYLSNQGLIYSHAVFMANMGKVVDEEIWRDKKNRETIKLSIDHILTTHDFENKIATIINAQLKEYRDSEPQQFYSEDSFIRYKRDIENRLKNALGEKSWNKLENKVQILEEVSQKFIERFKRNMGKGEFLKIERIDNKVISFLRGENEDGMVYCSNEKQLEKLYHPSDIERFKSVPLREKGKIIQRDGKTLMGLGSPVIPAIKNPMATRTLHQLRKLVNELIKEDIIDEKTKVHIELARELNDANKRAAINRYQREREKQRSIYREKIRELYQEHTGKDISPTDDDVLKFTSWVEQDPDHVPPISDRDIEKYQYWEEQYHRCIYTGNTINITNFIGPNPKYDIEHTIPRSIVPDNSQMNKTLCDIEFNRKIKGNKMPFELNNHEEVLQRIEPWKEKYEDLENQIEILKKRAKTATTKEQKDKIIQERHYLTLHRDYWRGKYERFTREEVTAGFKNSQKVDVGIITKYAREFLASLFKNRNGNPNVYSVNGQMVDAFRKTWGLHEKELDENGQPILDNNGFPVFKEKDRSNHVHHCIDAITIACMTRDKYDVLAHAWGLEDKGILQDARKVMEDSKPWNSFTEDVKEIKNEVLVVHRSKDNVPKQSRKKLRIRGKIKYKDKDKKQPIYLQGDTARGSLHQDTFYGAIKNNGSDKVQYVVRKKLSDLSDADLVKIIDKKIRAVTIAARVEEKRLKQEIEGFKKRLKTADNEQEKYLRSQIEEIQNKIDNELYVIPPKRGKNTSTPIRKVRIKAHLADPLPNFKEHRDKKKNPDGSEKYPHKGRYYVQNDVNYCLALYESADKKKRAAEIVKLIDAAHHFKMSNDIRNELPLVEPQKKGMQLKGLLKPSILVLFYKNDPEELWELNQNDLRQRLYFIKKTSKNGQTTFQFHQDSRNDEQMKEDYKKRYGTEPPKSLTNGESKIDFNKTPVPRLLLSPVNMTMLIEGVDFKITPIGKIEPVGLNIH